MVVTHGTIVPLFALPFQKNVGKTKETLDLDFCEVVVVDKD